MNTQDNSEFLYIIHSDFERTYCGVTNNIIRRINQHNGIIKGGAKSTKGREWEYFCIISGFESRQELLQFEWRMHHPDGKRRRASKYNGIEGRILAIKDVFHWWRNIKNKRNKMKLCVLNEYMEFIGDLEEVEIEELIF